MKNQQKTHCPKGHEYTFENSYINPKGVKVCRKCTSIKNRKQRENNLQKHRERDKKYKIKNSESIKLSGIKSNLKRHFNLTLEEYNDILNKQNNVCAICEKVCSTGKRLAVDHNHETGQIRGLLCSTCNKGIGLFKEQISILQKSINYLKEQK